MRCVRWQTDNYDAMFFGEAYKRKCAVAIVAVKDKEAVVTRVIEAGSGRRGEILFEPQRAQFLIRPTIGRNRNTVMSVSVVISD